MISKPLRSQFMYFTGSLLQSIDWVFKPGDSKSQPRGWKTKSQGQKLHSEHELRSQRLKNAILRFQFQRSGFWRSEKSTYMNRLLNISIDSLCDKEIKAKACNLVSFICPDRNYRGTSVIISLWIWQWLELHSIP